MSLFALVHPLALPSLLPPPSFRHSPASVSPTQSCDSGSVEEFSDTALLQGLSPDISSGASWHVRAVCISDSRASASERPDR
eukprot:2611601-Rhodomonas_salina.2